MVLIIGKMDQYANKCKVLIKISIMRLLMLVLYFSLRCMCTELNAFRVEDPNSVVGVSTEGVVHVQSSKTMAVRLFSPSLFLLNTQISFTNVQAASGSDCDYLRTEIKNVNSVVANTAVVNVIFQPEVKGDTLMFCVRTTSGRDNKSSAWKHQGNSSWLQIVVVPDHGDTYLLPTWAQYFLIAVFLCLSAIFSGLALILLPLTKSELKVLKNYGTSKERSYAKSVMPFLKHGNYLLCTILLVNTVTNVATTVMLYQLFELYAVLVSTFGVFFLGEIIPQTVCSWFGLVIGTKMAWFTNIFLILTFPISYPVSRLMDLLFRNEIPRAYNRDRLFELVKSISTEHSIKFGKTVTAVDLSTKCVKDIMTKLEDVFMVEYNSMLTSNMLNQILKTGFARVPIYETDRANIVAVLHVKDLALLDPDGTTSLKTLCKFFNHPVNFVFEDTKLNVMLEEFKKGRSHMVFVQHVNSEGPGDPFYETLGMVTLEDVIEDIFQSEICDESAIVLNNKELIARLQKMNMGSFSKIHTEKNKAVSCKMLQAAKAFLSSSVAQFDSQWISERVLEHLIEQSNVITIQLSDNPTNCCIYEMGKISDYFVLVLNGNVQIDIGKDHFTFTEGPFSFFGLKVLTDTVDILTNSLVLGTISETVALQESHYVPDFALRAITDVQYLRITKAVYLAALRASLLQQQHLTVRNMEMRFPEYDCLQNIQTVAEPFLKDGSIEQRLLEPSASSRTKLLAKSGYI